MGRSASGARQGGDAFQHLVAWNRVLRARRRPNEFVRVGLEAAGAGNLDDVTIDFSGSPSEFVQVKYSVDTSSPINLDFLTSVKRSNSNGRRRGPTSVLQKLHNTWHQLSEDGPLPRLQLVTNKLPDPQDGLFRGIDSRTSRLDGALAQQPKLLAEIASHLNVEDDEVAAFFCAIEFLVGRSFEVEMQLADLLMDGQGMRSDEPAIRQGVDLIRTYVLDGSRVVERDQIENDIADLGLAVAAPTPAIAVQAIGWDPTASEADEILDWVDLYEGDVPQARRRPIRPDVYGTTMQPELDAAAARLLAGVPPRVRVRGFMRLPAWFALGAALPKVRQVELEIRQGPATWTTDGTPDPGVELDITWPAGPQQGDHLAVVLAITNDLVPDVLAYIGQESLPVGFVQVISATGGPHDGSIRDGTHAVAIAIATRNAVRDALRHTAAPHIHLFAAAPGGLMAMLGHRWNRLAPTTTYEDLAPGYLPAFAVPG